MRPCLIGVAGPSCAGKSELAGRLAQALAAPVLSLDSYYQDLSHLPLEERAQMNFDEPAALDRDLLFAQLAELAGGRPIRTPTYDFSQHTRTPRLEILEPSAYLIIEGLFTIYWEDIRRLMGLRVFVWAPHEVCLARRLERDVRERGRTPESVIQQYQATVKPMAEQHVLPTRRFADLLLNGTDPPESLVQSVLARLRRACGSV